MAVTIVVLSGGAPGAPELSLTLDTPRIVIGRGEGCEVRLPDASVSGRHASLRQRGGEYLLFDENSKNGTFLGPVRLPPQAPHGVRSGEKVRVGRVWLEVRIEPAIVKGSTAALAKELALSLVSRGLASQGREPGPRVTVQAGPSAGKTLVLDEAGRSYDLGGHDDADLVLDDDRAAARHARVMRRGDALLLRDVAGGTLLDGVRLVAAEATWKQGQVVEIGRDRLVFDFPAAEALLEIERAPDEAMTDDEVLAPPAGEAVEPTPASSEEATPTPASPGPAALRRRAPSRRSGDAAWSVLDSVVVLLALGVIALSVLGAFWLLGR